MYGSLQRDTLGGEKGLVAGQTPFETGSEEAGEGALESEVKLLVPTLFRCRRL